MGIKNASLLKIHIAVFLFGLSGLFGKLLGLGSIVIVFGRVLFSSIFLMIMTQYTKKSLALKERKHYVYLTIMGLILALHWTTFFKAIQVSTIAVGLLTFSTFPVFVTFLEPWFFKEKLRLLDIIVSVITFIGVAIVVPLSSASSNILEGAVWGIVSGFTYAVLSMLNRKYVEEYSSLVIALYEQVIAVIILLPLVVIQRPIFQVRDMALLILLGVVFTGISHTLFINGLKTIKAQTASIISSLEPVYGIIFAAIILAQLPTLREVLGGVIILGASFYSSIRA